MVAELINKYIWLVQTIMRTGQHGLSFKEIAGKWECRYGEKYSRRTFNNHREAIEIIFSIFIECDRSTNTYYIDTAQNEGKLSDDAARLLSSLTEREMLAGSNKKLMGRVSVESVPSGHSFLIPIMGAMEENVRIDFEYHKYNEKTPSIYTIEPYAVKEFAKRWYMIGPCLSKNGQDYPVKEAGKLRIFGLDRIVSLHLTDRNFEMDRNFDVDELFATSFGIYLTDQKAVNVRFRAPLKEARFIKDLPLHGSQRVVSEDTEYTVFEIFAVPDRNMLMEFRRLGPDVEVLEPESLRKEIRAEAWKMYKLYKNKN